MIDYEVKIFNQARDAAASMCAKDRFLSTPILSYASLPAASVFEMDSRTVQERQSSTPTENFSRLTYQVDVVAKTKSKCRSIYKAIDDRMIAMNFSRLAGEYVTYPDNPDIVRYVARYQVDVDPNGNLYRG